MKIAFFHFSFDGAGGVERFLSVWANEFISKGHEVYFISINHCGQFVYDLNPQVKLIDLGFPMKRLTILKPLLIRKINKVIGKYGIDVTIAQSIKASYILGWAAQKYPICAVGMEHLGFDCELHGSKHRALRKKFYPFLKGFVTLTPDDEQAYRSLGVLQVSTIFNPVITPAHHQHHSDSKILLAIGRQDHQKNFPALLRIFKSLNRADLILRIVGKDYGTRQSLIDQAKVLNIDEKIEFVDFQADVSNFYYSSSVFLLTSIYEGLPLVLIESKAHGLPCISYDCPTGPRHIINDGIDGFLVPMHDELLMAQRISEYMDNPELQHSMSRAGVADVAQRFSIPVLYSQWETFLQRLIHES
ncbi:MAG: glycosyltransferase [Breznakibacter sp.]